MPEFEQNFLAGIPLLQMHKHLPNVAMILLSLLLLYLAIKKKYEPFLLLPLGFGMISRFFSGVFPALKVSPYRKRPLSA